MDEVTMAHRVLEEVIAASPLSVSQQKWLVFLPLFPCLLSIVASAVIVYLVVLSGFSGSYRRLLFVMGLVEVLTKLGFAIQPFLLPTETSFRAHANGTDASCSFVGSLTQLSVAAFFYNGILSLYFLLLVRSGLKDIDFARKYELWAHCLAIGWTFASTIVGAGAGFFHEQELGPGCWISEYPQGCEVDPSSDCRTNIIAWAMSLAPMWAMIFFVIMNTLAMVAFVRQETIAGALESRLGQDRELSSLASFYAAVFLITYLPMILLSTLETIGMGREDEVSIFPLLIIQALVMPLNGVLILCIYLRPRYMRCRIAYPDDSWVWSAQRALYGEIINPKASVLSSSVRPTRQSIIEKRQSGSSLTLRRYSTSNPDVLEMSHRSSPSRPTSIRYDDESSAFKIAEIMEESGSIEDPLDMNSQSELGARSTEKDDDDIAPFY